MPLIDKDQEELLQRRLEETIKTNVEAKLFRYYRNIGSIIIAVLGVVGVTIGWPTLKTQIDNKIEKQIENRIAEKVDEQVNEAKESAKRAKNKADESLRKTELGLELIQDKQKRITDTLGRLNARSDDLNVTFATIDAEIDVLNQNAEDLQEKMYAFNEQFKFNLATQSDLDKINKALSDLAVKSSDLAATVKELKSNNSSTAGELAISFKDVAIQAKERSKAGVTVKSTVYVQFAGGSREDIKRITEILKKKEWLVPGEERTKHALSRKEVRYFHSQDKEAAEKLASDTNTAIEAIGLTTTVSTEDYTSFSKLPRQGILELWISLPLQ